MGTHRSPSSARRAEARLRTGAAAHLLGGALDVLAALGAYARKRLRDRTPRSGSGPAGPKTA